MPRLPFSSSLLRISRTISALDLPPVETTISEHLLYKAVLLPKRSRWPPLPRRLHTGRPSCSDRLSRPDMTLKGASRYTTLFSRLTSSHRFAKRPSAPPPTETTPLPLLTASLRAAVSSRRKAPSPAAEKISPISIPDRFSIIRSVSTNCTPIARASRLPIVVFPAPMKPARTIILPHTEAGFITFGVMKIRSSLLSWF